jgi:hypothetical protein
LLERAGDADRLDASALELRFGLMLRLGHRTGNVAIEHIRRCLHHGDLSAAADAAERARNGLHWTEANEIATALIDALQREHPDGWSDERLLQGLLAIGLAVDAIRGAKDVDLGDAIEIARSVRLALEPLPEILSTELGGIEGELVSAWESTEVHRAALEELSESHIARLRSALNGKRVLVIGGRQPVWWPDLVVELGLAKSSSWHQSEPGKRPPRERLKAILDGGKVAVLVIIVDYIAHATSDIRDVAQERSVRTVDARSGRYSLVRALDRSTSA